MNECSKGTNRRPLVSVVIPAFNRSQTISNTIVSVVENDYRPIQIIVVDDGSVDNTDLVVDGVIKKYSDLACEIKYIKQDNFGACRARNHGLAQSTGDFVFFLDSDDTVSASKIASQVAVMEDDEIDMCISDFSIHYKNMPDETDKYQNNSKFLWKVLNNGSVGCSTCLMKSSLAKSVNWTEPLSNYQDVDYFLKIIILAKNARHLPISTYRYIRFNEDSITTAHQNKVIPYKKRIKSLVTDCLLNFNYNKGALPRIYTVYAIVRILLTAIRVKKT